MNSVLQPVFLLCLAKEKFFLDQVIFPKKCYKTAESCFHGSGLYPSPHSIAGMECTKFWHLVEMEEDSGKQRGNGALKAVQVWHNFESLGIGQPHYL